LAIEDYVKSGTIFLASKFEDRLPPIETELFRENQFLYAMAKGVTARLVLF
jgi:hypothetical protein